MDSQAAAAASEPGVLEPWEVFRREESVHLWVVRRSDIHDLADLDLLQPPLDRSFKKPGGYVMRDKLAAAREQSGQSKPKANKGTR